MKKSIEQIEDELTENCAQCSSGVCLRYLGGNTVSVWLEDYVNKGRVILCAEWGYTYTFESCITCLGTSKFPPTRSREWAIIE